MGTLFVVATPIGNLEDITLRALRVLKEVDLIAAEDTRRTRKLLTHYQIKTPVISYHAHNQESRGPELIARLKEGQSLALVSDAGTPGFSDPGADLVARAWDAGIKVEAVPGPAAGVAALSLSGFKGDVTFLGFLPRKAGKRREMLASLAPEQRVLILYESPRRLGVTLKELAQYLGNRQVLVIRELSKLFEESWRGPLLEIAGLLAEKELKGECTLVLSRPQEETTREVDVAKHLVDAAQKTQLAGRKLTEQVAAALKLPRRQVYQTYLHLKAQSRLP